MPAFMFADNGTPARSFVAPYKYGICEDKLLQHLLPHIDVSRGSLSFSQGCALQSVAKLIDVCNPARKHQAVPLGAHSKHVPIRRRSCTLAGIIPSQRRQTSNGAQQIRYRQAVPRQCGACSSSHRIEVVYDHNTSPTHVMRKKLAHTHVMSKFL